MNKEKRHVMEFYSILQMNLFAFLILFLIFVNIKNSSRYILFDQKLFLSLIFVTLSLLLIDILRAFANGKATLAFINMNMIFSSLNYILAPLTTFTWYLYLNYTIYESKARLKKKFFILSLPILINTIFVALNFSNGRFYQFMFSIDNMNIYSRGPHFYIVIIISYGYLLYSFIEMLVNRKSIDLKDCYYLCSFLILPLLASLMQSVFYGIKLIWPSLTLSIFIIYINIQNRQLYLDTLTGLYNRRKLNIYLDDIIDRNKKSLIGGIMIDLDDFKHINDTFGHREGDKALVHVADILKYNFRKQDFLARYAGDEFLIILTIDKASDMKGIVKRLKTNIDSFNKDNITPYKLSLSMGYDVFYPDSYITSDDFVVRIDNLMYKQKENKKLLTPSEIESNII